ncbi:sirohydrochlorin cobaltochelatase [Pectinatus brassicae]|uniref:Sirohydrochlorin cobaltochelatase n=1 Tax=Pectinatus brassicae TaxID=862415 RepID=A0A840UE63_9FIRM|nr:sirohydrochlorin cobaltochelatase [Pectinatus brassicae]MBB5335319.1 sirohydrochlorin cobaltochelatase [Pectinatus brassicae]
MFSWKKMVVASMACMTMTGFMATSYASYKLNPMVHDATPALKKAAEIGVRTYNNPQMANAADKDAILVMSFGTTFKDTRQKTIDATVNAIKVAHPNTKVILSFTSHIIIDRIKKNEGLDIPTPEQALKDLKAQGYTRVAIASLDVIPGMEYAYDTAVYDLYKKDFKKMTLGVSAMYWMGQENQRDDVTEFLKAFSTQFPKNTAKDEAVLIMGHGTPSPDNAYYSVIQNHMNMLNMKNTYIYTVEGWPSLETVIPQLKAKGIKKVTLMPMMMVAGDHANNDMAGNEPDSHKSILEKEGFTVKTYIHGLGENKAVRQIFVERANEAWQALEAK